MDLNQASALFTKQTDYMESRAIILAALGRHPSLLLCLRERRRQVEFYGVTEEADRLRQNGMQLSKGALCFIKQALLMQSHGGGAAPGRPFQEWPWAAETWNPPHTKEEALVKAMALLGAELDRIMANRAQEEAEARLAHRAE